MKQASNNEVDLLLRALAKGERRALRPENGKRTATSDHLDADELNSYSEGVVPDAARGRYTQHLANCDLCRSIIITLSQSAGSFAQASVENAETGTSFRAALMALFSPAVLRYAIPALVVTAVIAISLIALRQPQQPPLVAKNDAAAPQSKSGEALQSQIESSPTPQQPPAISTYQANASQAANTSREKKAVTESEAPMGRAAAVDEIAKRELKDLPAVSKAPASDLRPTYAPEPAPPPLAPALSTSKETGGVAENQAERGKTARDEDKLWNQPKDDTSGPSRSRSQTLGRRADGITASGPQKSGEVFKQKSAGDVETRSIGGKQFRREGNTWVDTSFGAPRAITNVARNSEQFRALVADEPGLRTFAEQLSGDVIVVWKGKAYRFR